MRINLLIILLVSINIYGQSNYHNGKIKLSDQSELDVLMDYGGWIKTPEQLKVKYQDEVRIYEPEQLLEFTIDGDRYISRKVNLDITNQDLQKLNSTINQQTELRHIFLRVLVDGAASLYSFRDTRTHYFVSKSGESEIIELDNLKRMLNSSVSYSKKYVGQLSLLLADCVESGRVDKVRFAKSSLLKVIKEYNQCKEGGSNYVVKKNPIKAELLLLGGYKSSTYELPSEGFYSNYILDSDSDGNLTFGVGLNINLLRNTERLQFYNELLYQQYGFSGSYRDQRLPQQFFDYQLDVDLSYLELSTLIRFNFTDNNKKLRPFLNAGMVNAFQLSDNSSESVNIVFFDAETLREREPLEDQIVSHRLFFTFGAGLEFSRFSFEFRYGFNPEISGFPVIVKSEIINLLLGVQLF